MIMNNYLSTLLADSKNFKLLDFKKVVLINMYLLCNVVLFLLYNRMHQRYVYIVLLPDETSSHTLISPL